MWWGLAVLLCLVSGSAGAQETAAGDAERGHDGETRAPSRSS